MSPQVLFRRAAIAEAVTWALLLVGMFVKYVVRATELGVQVFGMVHGVVFIAFCLVAVFVSVDRRWSAGTTLLALASAVPPFATVWFHRRAERRGLLDTAWRLSGASGERPEGPVERAQAWMLRRPVASVGVAVAAVGVLTAAALVVGPPVPSPG